MGYQSVIKGKPSALKDVLAIYPQFAYFAAKEFKNIALAEILPKKIKARMNIPNKHSLDYICGVDENDMRLACKTVGAGMCLIDGIPDQSLGAIVLGLYLIGDGVYDLVELIKDGGNKSIMESSATIGVEGLYTLYEKAKNIFKK